MGTPVPLQQLRAAPAAHGGTFWRSGLLFQTLLCNNWLERRIRPCRPSPLCRTMERGDDPAAALGRLRRALGAAGRGCCGAQGWVLRAEGLPASGEKSHVADEFLKCKW